MGSRTSISENVSRIWLIGTENTLKVQVIGDTIADSIFKAEKKLQLSKTPFFVQLIHIPFLGDLTIDNVLLDEQDLLEMELKYLHLRNIQTFVPEPDPTVPFKLNTLVIEKNVSVKALDRVLTLCSTIPPCCAD